MHSSHARVPIAPLPECPAVFKITYTSNEKARKHKKQQRAITEPQELDRLAQHTVNLALSCPPLTTAAGPYVLTIHDEEDINLPPVMDAKVDKILRQRSHGRARRTLAMSDTAHHMEVNQTAKMIGMSAAEFNRPRQKKKEKPTMKERLENFIVDLRDNGDNTEENNSENDDVKNVHNIDAGLKQARRTRRLREREARLHVYQEFSVICKQNIEKQEFLKHLTSGSGALSLGTYDDDDDESIGFSKYISKSSASSGGKEHYNHRKSIKKSVVRSSSIREPSGAEMLAKARGEYEDRMYPNAQKLHRSIHENNSSNGGGGGGIGGTGIDLVSQSKSNDDKQEAEASQPIEVIESRLFTSLENADFHSQEVIVPPGAVADVRSVVRAAARVRMKDSRVNSPFHRSHYTGSYASSNGSVGGSHYDNFSHGGFGGDHHYAARDDAATSRGSGDGGASGVGDGDKLSRGWGDDDKSYGDSSGTDTISLPTYMQQGLGGATQHRQVGAEVYVSDLSKLIHGLDYEVDGSSMLNESLESPRSPNTNTSYQNASSYGHPNSPTSPLSPHNHDGVSLLLSTLNPQLKKAIRHLHDALVIRGLSIVTIADAAYLDQWHRGHSDMFLEVSDDGPPRTISLEEAEKMILYAISLTIEEAASLKHRANILKKRREKATRRAASKVWLSTKDALPHSMTDPEYLSKADVAEIALEVQQEFRPPSTPPSNTGDQTSSFSSPQRAGVVGERLNNNNTKKDEEEDKNLLLSENEIKEVKEKNGDEKEEENNENNNKELKLNGNLEIDKTGKLQENQNENTLKKEKRNSFNFDEFYDNFKHNDEQEKNENNNEDDDINHMKMKNKGSPSMSSFSSKPKARAIIVPGSKHAQREMQQQRQEAFEARKYPAYTRENARR